MMNFKLKSFNKRTLTSRFGSSMTMALVLSLTISSFCLNGQIIGTPIMVNNDPGSCGAFVTVPKPCPEAMNLSGFYPVGVTIVQSICGGSVVNIAISVVDREGPLFNNCAPKVITLGALDCGPTASSLLDIVDNCDAKSTLTITPGPGNTFPADHRFAAGSYSLNYIARDRSGNSSSCTFNLTVNGFGGAVSSVACYKDLNISLSDACEGIITPENVLEGGPYGCLEDFKVTIYDINNNPIGNKVDARHIGQKLKVEVLAPNGNKCWGYVLVEDKKGPDLECKPIYTTCAGSTVPGSPLPRNITFRSDVRDSILSSGAPSSKKFRVNVFGLKIGSTIDLNAVVKINHANVSHLSVSLTAPTGTSVVLFNTLGTCSKANTDLTFDDEALLTNAKLIDSCYTTSPAKKGTFKPLNPLSVFDGIDPNGIWEFTITDNTAGVGGAVKSLQLIFDQLGNTVCFPTTKSIVAIPNGTNSYLVTGIDNCSAATLTYKDNVVKQPCDSLYHSIIYRTWNAVDAVGNISKECTQLIYIYKSDLWSVKLPKNFDGLDTSVLSCIDYANTVPGPNITGRPSGDYCDNIQVFPYEDFRFAGCDKSYKILRRWKIADWCTGEILTHDQIIKVADDDGPVMTCPSDVTISTSTDDCNARYKAPRPTITKECSNTIKYQLSYHIPAPGTTTLVPGAIFTQEFVIGDSIISKLPLGVAFVKWTLTDLCLNSSSCTYKVTVKDLVTPVTVCRQFTTISIGAQGGAELDAKSFDEKSYDNCGIVKYEAIKMVDLCSSSPPVFSTKIRFCCQEVGTSVMVALRVTDAAGNSNTCMVEIKVEDKLPPYIVCPDDKTIDCKVDFKNTAITGFPIFGDNCGVPAGPTFKDSINLDHCGRGIILRTWTVIDGRGLRSNCLQKITIVNLNPFTSDSIVWPLDYETNNCSKGLRPDSLPLVNRRPIIKNSGCNITAVTYKDQVFKYAPGSCEKVLRTWTVIDWCNYNEQNRYGYYEKTQILKIYNTNPPEFQNCKNDTILIFDNCQGSVSQSKTAIDDCTPSSFLAYSYTIDLYDDGISDGISGNTDSFIRTLPVGKHRVRWTADDLCGNIGVCSYLIVVRDGKKPTPYCLSSITTVVMPKNGMVAIWAKDFDFGSSDNCTPKNKLKFSFSRDTSETSKTLTCNDIPNGKEFTLPLQMWVTDEAGNQEYCSVSMVIQDNTGNVCPDNNNPLINLAGTITTSTGVPLKATDVKLTNGDTKHIVLTNTQGYYEMKNIKSDLSYALTAQKNDEIDNGISTIDLLKIQRHILALGKFTNPYDQIASDFNGDGRINVADLVAIKKIVLGVETQMPNGQNTWKFINPNSLKSNDLTNMDYLEYYDIKAYSGTQNQRDFIAVRMGDVDGSARVNLQSNNLSSRSESLLDLEKRAVDALGRKFELILNQDFDILGLQLCFEKIANNKIMNVTSSMVNINEDNIGMDKDGRIRISWNEAIPTILKKGATLLTIEFDKSIDLEDLTLARETFNQIYDHELNTHYVKLMDRNNSDLTFKLYQNEPNPFIDQTKILIELPKDGYVNLLIHDATGRLILNEKREVRKGKNSLLVDKTQLANSGLLIYEVSFEGIRKTGKMILLK